jgi:hypothetical protein
MGWLLGLGPATLEFWVRFPNVRNQGKQAPYVKVPGSSRVPSPHANSFVIGTAVINTHKCDFLTNKKNDPVFAAVMDGMQVVINQV